MDAESTRLAEDARRARNWKRWGPYLAERQWGTVREDYSPAGECWGYLPHDHARSRAYRWGEDGLLGLTDREGRLALALALWNGRDPILKERLFGLTGPEGNHGEDVKECYYYLDATPTHSYNRALYKYPQQAFPYAELVAENARRGKRDPEYELADAGAFDGGRYFDVQAEYAKAGPDDVLVRLTLSNRGPEAHALHVLPTLWFRNTWSWGGIGENFPPRGEIVLDGSARFRASHTTLGSYTLVGEVGGEGGTPTPLFTENETNFERVFGAPNAQPFVKDAFHRYIIEGRHDLVNPALAGSKAALYYRLTIPAGATATLRLRFFATDDAPSEPFGPMFDDTIALRKAEADEFYDGLLAPGTTTAERAVVRQAYAGLLWSKQFYYYVVKDWLDGDPAQPKPPAERLTGRNADWRHVHARDVLSVPDKWEYPWFAAWDLAFHVVPLAQIDPELAKSQLILLLREWYMHANGQLPAYEFAFDDVNPPVHAWACYRVYRMTGARGHRDRLFLERAFHKLLINFTWWVNRKDDEGNNLFGGGFLGLDNIGIFDRSKPLPTGGHLEQADGTAWMAFFCGTMLFIALELASEDPAYEDVASKFFEHYVAISEAMNALGGDGLWDETDGFYYDQLRTDGESIPLRIRSMVGIIPLFVCGILEDAVLERLPGFRKRLQWFIDNRPAVARHIVSGTFNRGPRAGAHSDGQPLEGRLLSIASRERLVRALRYVLDENEFLSPHGVRSLSRFHAEHPYVLEAKGTTYSVDYTPGESISGLFGGNSNWRGPVWFPLNYLLIEALDRYHLFYGDDLKVECPTGSGTYMTLSDVAHEIERRLASVFLPDASGARPVHGGDPRYASDPYWKDLVLFYEYFHGDTGRGIGASHQTGWTALVVRFIEAAARRRTL
jgi:mannosylglycerate hydrolase MGH1-like protein